MALSMSALPDRLQRRVTMSRAERLDMIGMRARSEMLPRLARFIKFLAINGIVRFGEPLPRGERGLVAVDRIQQCAFLALYYGHDMDFEFGSFSNGPVSEEIADGVYRLSDEDSGVYRAASPDMPASFRTAEFLDFASGGSAEWMCAAISLLDANIAERKDLPAIKEMLRSNMSRSHDAVDRAFDEIERRGMFRLD